MTGVQTCALPICRVWPGVRDDSDIHPQPIEPLKQQIEPRRDGACGRPHVVFGIKEVIELLVAHIAKHLAKLSGIVEHRPRPCRGDGGKHFGAVALGVLGSLIGPTERGQSRPVPLGKQRVIPRKLREGVRPVKEDSFRQRL